MPELTTDPAIKYTVWVNGLHVKGSADQVLSRIQQESKSDSTLRSLSVRQYADSLIRDASYFFPSGRVPEILSSQQFPSPFDQALAYLDAMPSSGVRILGRSSTDPNGPCPK